MPSTGQVPLPRREQIERKPVEVTGRAGPNEELVDAVDDLHGEIDSILESSRS
jgi:hypothetical protein